MGPPGGAECFRPEEEPFQINLRYIRELDAAAVARELKERGFAYDKKSPLKRNQERLALARVGMLDE